MIATETRNANLQDLVALLKEQHGRKIDVVVPATALRSKNGVLHLTSTEVILDADGVTPVAGDYRPTPHCDGDLANRLGIPVRYLNRLRAERTDLYDANVNGLLHGKTVRKADGTTDVQHPADTRSFLLRTFRGDDGGEGIARAVLSDRYGIVDHLDVLFAALDGIKEAGVNVEVDSCDLTETRMQVRVVCREISALAPKLLAGYRSPFGGPDPVLRAGWTLDRARAAAAREGQGYEPGSEPVVFAGFVITDSETGDGAATITPRFVVEVCGNGLTVTADAMRAVHLGGRKDDGVVQVSGDTREKELAVITARARDAVKTCLDIDYMTSVLEKIEEAAGAPVKDAAKTVEVISKALKFDETAQAGILGHFIRGGQMTAGGMLNAVTSYAQTVPSADAAWDLEANALKVLELVR